MKTLRSLLGIVLGTTSFVLAVQLLYMHVEAFHELRATALPIAGTLAPLERRMHLLQAQLELSALQANLRTSAAEEKLHVFVLPAGASSERLLRFFEVLSTYGEASGVIRHMAPLVLAEPTVLPSDDPAAPFALTRRSLPLSLEVQEEFRPTLQLIFDLTGVLTVGDLLTPAERDQLFLLTEVEKPSAIVALEKFFGTDALVYLRSPVEAEQQLLQGFGSDQASLVLRSILDQPRLKAAQELMQGDFGDRLIAEKLWPLQFMQPDWSVRTRLGDGWVRLETQLSVYGRADSQLGSP